MGVRFISHSFMLFCVLHIIQVAVMCSGQTVRLDDRDSSITYSPGWIHRENSGDYLTTTTQSNNPGSSLVVPFVGTKISIFGSTAPLECGEVPRVTFVVDDNTGKDNMEAKPTVSINNESQFQQLFFTSSILSSGPHVLTATVIDVPSANASFSFDYAEFDTLDFAPSSTTPPTPGSTPSPQATRFDEGMDGLITSGLSMAASGVVSSPTSVNFVHDAPTTVQSSGSSASNTQDPIVLLVPSDITTTPSVSAIISSTRTISAVFSGVSSSNSSSSSSSNNELNNRHILPLVVGIVITCLFLFLLALGTFHTSRARKTRRSLRESRYTHSPFEMFPLRTFDPAASTASRDERNLIPFVAPLPSGHTHTRLNLNHLRRVRPLSHTEERLFHSQRMPMILSSSPVTPTWIASAGGRMDDGLEPGLPSEDASKLWTLDADSVNDNSNTAQPPPPYQLRHSLLKLDV